MEAQLRELLAGQADVRIALVVAEQDVVARLERLDQVVLEQQRLAFGARDRGLDARDLRDHHRDARLVRALLEVARHALLQVARLADVERVAGGVLHPVDAGPVRQRRDQLARVECRRRLAERRRGHRRGAVIAQPRRGDRPAARRGPSRPRCRATASNTERNIAGVSRRVLVL